LFSLQNNWETFDCCGNSFKVCFGLFSLTIVLRQSLWFSTTGNIKLFGVSLQVEDVSQNKRFQNKVIENQAQASQFLDAITNKTAADFWRQNFGTKSSSVKTKQLLDALRLSAREEILSPSKYDSLDNILQQLQKRLDPESSGIVTIHIYQENTESQDLVQQLVKHLNDPNFLTLKLSEADKERARVGIFGKSSSQRKVKQIRWEDFGGLSACMDFCRDVGMYIDEDNPPGKDKCIGWLNSQQQQMLARKDSYNGAVQDARAGYKVLSDQLLDAAVHVQALLMQIPYEDRTKEVVQKVTQFPELLRTIDNPDCRILVFGETNVGKSAFLNLLLEYDLVPSRAVHCTASIAEIKYSLTGYLKIKSSNNEIRSWPLDTTSQTEATDKIAQLLYVDSNSREKWDQPLIQIGWPGPILEAGVTLVDSPGINENAALDSIVHGYIPFAVGIICIINSAQGFSQKVREVLDMAHSVMGASFNPGAFLFVCSKIDTVPAQSREEVKTSIKKKIQSWFESVKKGSAPSTNDAGYSSEFNVDSQTIFMNVQACLTASRYGLETAEYSASKPIISNFIRRGFYFKIQKYYNECWAYLRGGADLISSMVAANKKDVAQIQKDKDTYNRVLLRIEEKTLRRDLEQQVDSEILNLKREMLVSARNIDVRELGRGITLKKRSQTKKIAEDFLEGLDKEWSERYSMHAINHFTAFKKRMRDLVTEKVKALYKDLKEAENEILGIDEEVNVDEITQTFENIQEKEVNNWDAGDVIAEGIALLIVTVIFTPLVAILSPLLLVGFAQDKLKDSKEVDQALGNPDRFKDGLISDHFTEDNLLKRIESFIEGAKIQANCMKKIDVGIEHLQQIKENSIDLIKKKDQSIKAGQDRIKEYLPLAGELRLVRDKLSSCGDFLIKELQTSNTKVTSDTIRRAKRPLVTRRTSIRSILRTDL